MLNFIAGPWGVLIGKALMILTLMTMIYVAVSQYNESIRNHQQMIDQKAQLEQVVKDNKEFQIRLDSLQQINQDILIRLDKKNIRVIRTHEKVAQYISSPEAQKSNREASPIIKNTIRMLKNEE